MSEDFLDRTYYAWNTQGFLSDILDFLQFSETNIELRRQRELDALEGNAKDNELRDEYIAHLKKNIKNRFDITLSQRLRYAVL